MKIALYLFLTPIGLALGLLLLGQLGLLRGQAPADLGHQSGRLRPPSATANSVSSQAQLYPEHPLQRYALISPLPLKSAGAEASWAALAQALASQPGVRVLRREADYLHAEAETRWLRFVDDLEFVLDRELQVLQVRSASRLGRKDLGANRKRLEAIRLAYLALP